MKKTLTILLIACMLLLVACGEKPDPEPVPETSSSAEPSSAAETVDTAIDYMVLVNKQNALPDGWEDALETVHMTNSIGDDVEVEAKAYDAYLRLKADLESEGIYVDLDSAYRSVAEQTRIMNSFIEEYGEDYAIMTVATPGCSEHHTGLALDLYLIVDGQDIVKNEDLVQYPEIWAKIHEKLADYGFILRYLEGKEDITTYSYEPWHIRYIDDVDTAKEIMAAGITLEEYFGEAGSYEGGKGMVVGEKIKIDDITEFYYTYASSTFPPDYLRYRFFVENGTYWFHYEVREGEHWPLTEEDITVSVDVELSQKQWQEFFDLIKGGSVTKREESADAGDAGPWMYIYWKKDKSKYQVYEFKSYASQKAFEKYCEKLAEKK